jgi:hypothetical protein
MEIEGVFVNQSDSFIQGMLDRMEMVRNEEFGKMEYEYQGFEKKEKEFRECKMDLRDYQQKMRKQVILNRGKSSKNEFIEHETVFDGCDDINIFEDDLFEKVEVDEIGVMKQEKKKETKKVSDFSDEELKSKIETYIKKKNINLEGKQRKDLDAILQGEKDWKKYIQLNKETGEIWKVDFIIKGEYRDVKIEMPYDNKQSKEDMKIMANRKKLLNRFKS